MLARLCEITSTRMFCAAMPVAAMFSARMMLSLIVRLSSLAEDAHHQADALVLLVHELLAVLVGALHLDHARHLADRADVRLLEEALDDAAVLEPGSGAVVGAEEDARLAEEPGPGPRRSRGRRAPPARRRPRRVPSAATAIAFASNGMVISPPPSSSSGWPSMLTTMPSALRVKAPARVSRSPAGVMTVK